MRAYNEEQFIEKSLISLLNQNFRPYRIIVINDGSTDKTLEILESFKEIEIINRKRKEKVEFFTSEEPKIINDGLERLANEHDQGFMVNQAIVDFWKSCNGERKVTELVELFAQQTGLQRKQVEKEVMQLLQQLRDGGLIAIAGQPDTPNVEFKK